MIEKLCACGCGQSIKAGNIFAHGHNSRYAHPMQGRKHTKETRKRLRETHQGPRPWRLGFTHSDEVRKRLSVSHTGVPLSDKHRASIGEASKRVWAGKSKEERGQWGKNISMGETGKVVSEESKRKHSETKKKAWQDPAYAKKCLTCSSPNKQEAKLMQILDDMYPGEWKFVGDGQVIINGKCPDFININGQKKIIELYGERWHQNDNPKDRADIFAPFGYKTLVIWVKELSNKKVAIPILEAFCGGQNG